MNSSLRVWHFWINYACGADLRAANISLFILQTQNSFHPWKEKKAQYLFLLLRSVIAVSVAGDLSWICAGASGHVLGWKVFFQRTSECHEQSASDKPLNMSKQTCCLRINKMQLLVVSVSDRRIHSAVLRDVQFCSGMTCRCLALKGKTVVLLFCFVFAKLCQSFVL